MKLKFEIDTDDLYRREDMDFENLLTDALQKEIIQNAKKFLGSDIFKKFAETAEKALIENIKLRMENFLMEEIVITGRYGEKDFVGSIEDLIKSRFDNVLLRPVNSSGQTLEGCSTSDQETWIEWRIKKRLEKTNGEIVEKYRNKIVDETSTAINQKLIEMKDLAIKEQVDRKFTEILKK